MTLDERFLREAIHLASEDLREGRGGPFGAVIVLDGKIISRGQNRVSATNDPTAHAEMMAIREACTKVGNFSLHGAIIYSSCEPCPMCLSAIYWARIGEIVYGATQADAAAIGFDDAFLYDELALPASERQIPVRQALHGLALGPFKEWEEWDGKTPY